MAEPKKPQDHKPKKAKVEKIEVVIGEGDDERSIPARKVTLDGITVTVQDRAVNDYRIPRALARDGMNGNIQALDIMLGQEQHDEVAQHFADQDGYIDQEAMASFTAAILNALSPNS